jgi:uncharacterized repeat protein (TIGR01451 family)
VDGSGNVYIADTGNNAIKEWSASTQQVTTLVSTGGGYPGGVAVDGSGNVYLSDHVTGAVEEMPFAFAGPANFTESASAGWDTLLPVLPSTASLAGIFTPASDQSWLTIGSIANGVVNFSFTANTSRSARTAHITVLGQQITVTQSTSAAVLTVTGIQAGNFIQGQNGARYTVTVSNATGASPSIGTVTVTEAIPTGLTLVSMAGSGWDCPAGGIACTRNDVLASGASYPAIIVTVNVGFGVTLQVTNQVSVSGGGSADAVSNDVTSISPYACDIDGNGPATVADVQLIVDEALGVIPAVNDLNGDGMVNITDVQIEINAALGLGCAAK